ncbi:MAG: LemA family protein [Actinomycetota bacterium]
MNGLYVLLGLLAVVLLWLLISYNRFVEQRNVMSNSWANIDTELRRRYDLVPNLVETVQGYAAHERAVLEAVTRARAAAAGTDGPASVQAEAEAPLVRALRELFAVVESYPDLKASRSFLALQDELVHTEDRIQAARRFYNANVRDYNRRVQSFPSNLVARLFGFGVGQYFNIDRALEPEAAAPPRVGP